jgi:hypothetical protein
LRWHYRRAGCIWLLADRAAGHTASSSLALAEQLHIRWLWLPKKAPELSSMDQLWRDLKRLVAANRQAETIDALAAEAVHWVMSLTARQARRKAGIASRNFWLRHVLHEFWPPT